MKGPDASRGILRSVIKPAEPGRCLVTWTSRFSGLPLQCMREDSHEGACRAANGWRDETEAVPSPLRSTDGR